MAKAGYFSEDALITLRKLGSPLQGIPRSRWPASRQPPARSGRASRSRRAALGAKLAGSPSRVYCILGDGEIQEGQVWEAAMAAPRLGHPAHPVDNLRIVDYNKIQLDDFVTRVLDLEPVVSKCRVRLAVIEIDGHEHGTDRQGARPGRGHEGTPTLVVAHTVKARACRSWRTTRSGTQAPKPAEAVAAIREILGVTEAPGTAISRPTRRPRPSSASCAHSTRK